MSYFYYRKEERVVVHKATGARLPFVPPRLGNLVVRVLSRLQGVDTKAEAEHEMARAVVEVADRALKGRR